MDDKTRFDQLEEIIVEMLHKQDRTIEDVGRLREAVAAQQVTLVHMQNDISRIEAEVAVVRRLATDTARVLNKSVAELTAANERNNRLLQDTALILVENRIFQEETRQALAENRGFQMDTRQALAENREFQVDTRQALAENKEFQMDTRQALAENKEFQADTRQALAENKEFQTETRQALSETRAALDKILALLTKP